MRGYVILFAFLLFVIVNAHKGDHHDKGLKDHHKGDDGKHKDGHHKERHFKKERDGVWSDFKKKFGKDYKDKDEDDKRRQHWEDRMDHVEKHNQEAKENKHKFTQIINKFADLTPQEIKALLGFVNPFQPGLLKSPRLLGLMPFNLKASDPETQKPSINWVDLGYVTSVKNQGMCGACWSFAAAGALEAVYKAESGNLVSLSEQELIDCSRPEGNDGCNGGAMVYAYEYIMLKGIETYAVYPFIGKDGPCKYNAKKVVTKIKGYVMIPEGSEEDLRMAVSAVGPVSAAIDASQESFMLYEDGIYDAPGCSSTALDHGILVVGYGSEDGQDYWLIKNSWGTDWGINGYMKMARNSQNECGIATQAEYPIKL